MSNHYSCRALFCGFFFFALFPLFVRRDGEVNLESDCAWVGQVSFLFLVTAGGGGKAIECLEMGDRKNGGNLALVDFEVGRHTFVAASTWSTRRDDTHQRPTITNANVPMTQSSPQAKTQEWRRTMRKSQNDCN